MTWPCGHFRVSRMISRSPGVGWSEKISAVLRGLREAGVPSPWPGGGHRVTKNQLPFHCLSLFKALISVLICSIFSFLLTLG